MQSRFILDKLQQNHFPTILVGDFNVAQSTESIKIISHEYQNANEIFGITATRPQGQMIDFAFSSNDMPVKNLRIEETDVSDHYALELEI
jgi:endonuclease/exonuclease/phosphatase family metal-dependent hydrolase